RSHVRSLCALPRSCPLVLLSDATATAELSPLSLHDALPICRTPGRDGPASPAPAWPGFARCGRSPPWKSRSSAPRRRWCSLATRSEEHTSELQSRENLVCRLLLEKKKERVESLLRPPPGAHG